MKKLLRKLNAGREGATLITVVIATAFLIAIGVVILAASTKYLVSVYVDRNSNEKLYDAEGVLAEVKTGLMEYAGDAAEAAYRLIAENYDTIGFDEVVDESGTVTKTPVSLRDRFSLLYITGIIQSLEGTGVKDGWKDKSWDDPDEVIKKAYYKTKNMVHDLKTGATPTEPDPQFNIENLQKLTNRRSAVTTKLKLEGSIFGEPETPADDPDADGSTGSDYLKCVVYRSPTKGYFLTIENLGIDYDENGYRQTITTDIQLIAPDYKFDGDDSYSDYILITDGKLKVDDQVPAAGEGASFDGNVYVGGATLSDDVNNAKIGYQDAGIYVDTGMKAHFNCQKLITRKNVTLNSGSDVEIGSPGMSGEAYIKNIKLISPGAGIGGGTKLKLKTNAYVENDLDIQDSSATVELSGTYYGYSYSEDNDKNNTPLADYSSAILVNGFGTLIQTGQTGEELNRLILSGRSYVSRVHQTHPLTTGGTGDTPVSNVLDPNVGNDVMMGESIAVKSNQVAYMVPDMYIRANHNPVNDDLDAAYGGDFFDPVSLLRTDDNEEILLMKDDSPLKEYLNESFPVTGNYASLNGKPYVFLYLNFKSQEAANDYFDAFYHNQIYPEANGDDPDAEDYSNVVTPDDIRKRAFSYISSNDGGVRLDPALLMIAGNIIRDYTADDDSGFQASNYFDGDGIVLQSLLDDGKRIGKRYVSYARSLDPAKDFGDNIRLYGTEPALVSNDGSDEQSKPMIVPDNIPNADHDPLKLSNGKEVNVVTKNTTTDSDLDISSTVLSEDGYVLAMNNGPVTISDDSAGLIIANGDVTVSANFTGLIISTGTVTVNRAKVLKADNIVVKQLIGMAQSDEKLSKVFRGSLDEPVTRNATDMGKCISYLNWTKNTY